MVTRVTATFSQSAEANLSRFRYHTGAQPRRLAGDEPCPPLFRDIGWEAMHRFLSDDLELLCGPISPITYLRTCDYVEPYTDYGRTGRLMLLRPELIVPWHSGLESIYIASRSTRIDPNIMVFIPAEIPLADAAEQFAAVSDRVELIDAIGRDRYRDAVAETQERLLHLRSSHAETERYAAPLRAKFQSRDLYDRELARTWMDRLQLTEQDLCTAWHHLPDDRREIIRASLCELTGVLP